MKANPTFWISRIWLAPGILIMFSFLLPSHQVHASGGRVQVEIRIPSVLTVQYAPTTHNGLKVGVSRDLQMQRTILIETTEAPPGKDQPHVTAKPSNSVKRVYMTIYTL